MANNYLRVMNSAEQCICGNGQEFALAKTVIVDELCDLVQNRRFLLKMHTKSSYVMVIHMRLIEIEFIASIVIVIKDYIGAGRKVFIMFHNRRTCKDKFLQL